MPSESISGTRVCIVCGELIPTVWVNRPHKRVFQCDYNRKIVCSPPCKYRLQSLRSRVPPEERFWDKVEKTETCWLWIASLGTNGYGIFKVNRRQYQPHRFAYEQIKGPIPEGLELDHLCRNPRCVNPDHLEPVTHAENMRRSGPYRKNKAKTDADARLRDSRGVR